MLILKHADGTTTHVHDMTKHDDGTHSLTLTNVAHFHRIRLGGKRGNQQGEGSCRSADTAPGIGGSHGTPSTHSHTAGHGCAQSNADAGHSTYQAHQTDGTTA